MVGITQNKQGYLIFIVIPWGRKKVHHIRAKGGVFNIKKVNGFASVSLKMEKHKKISLVFFVNYQEV